MNIIDFIFSKVFSPKITELAYRFHGWLGFKFSILLFVISFTGTYLVLRHSVEWIFYSEMRVIPQGQIDYDRIHEKILEKYPHGTITKISVPRSSRMVSSVSVELPVRISVESVQLNCNPYTGEIISGPHYSEWSIEKFIVRTHTRLYLGRNGYYLVCFIGLLLFKIVLFSIPLLPMSLPSMFWVRVNKGKRIFYSDLHKFMGVWGFIFVVIIGGTSTWYFTKSMLRNTKYFSKIIKFRPPSATPKLFKSKLNDYPDQLKISVNLNQSIEKVIEKIPNFSPTRINFGISKMEPWVVYGREGIFSPTRATSVYIDPFKGEIMEIRSYRDAPMGERFSYLMDVLHFGYFWGITSRILWGIFGIFLVLLSFTGILIRWKSISRTKDKSLGYFKYMSALLLFFTLWYAAKEATKKNSRDVSERIYFISPQGVPCEIRKTVFNSKSNNKETKALYVYFQNRFSLKKVQHPVKAFLSEKTLKNEKQTGGIAIFLIPETDEPLKDVRKKIKIEF